MERWLQHVQADTATSFQCSTILTNCPASSSGFSLYSYIFPSIIIRPKLHVCLYVCMLNVLKCVCVCVGVYVCCSFKASFQAQVMPKARQRQREMVQLFHRFRKAKEKGKSCTHSGSRCSYINCMCFSFVFHMHVCVFICVWIVRFWWGTRKVVPICTRRRKECVLPRRMGSWKL